LFEKYIKSDLKILVINGISEICVTLRTVRYRPKIEELSKNMKSTRGYWNSKDSWHHLLLVNFDVK
jgi:hypothetical protein